MFLHPKCYKSSEAKMRKAEFDFVVNHVVEQIVGFFIEDYDMSLNEAFGNIYESQTYLSLSNKSTGLYRYSPAYTYLRLLKELNLENRSQ